MSGEAKSRIWVLVYGLLALLTTAPILYLLEGRLFGPFFVGMAIAEILWIVVGLAFPRAFYHGTLRWNREGRIAMAVMLGVMLILLALLPYFAPVFDLLVVESYGLAD